MTALLLLVACAAAQVAAQPDWLITKINTPPTFTQNGDGTWSLSNGLISRTFTFTPGFGTVDFYSFTSETSLLRAIDEEGEVTLDDTTYALGGLIQTGTTHHAYLNRSAAGINFNPDGWDAQSWTLGAPTAPFPWTPGTRGSPADAQWPPLGLQLCVVLKPPASAVPQHKAISITLVYEMYAGVPFLTKWMTVNSTGPASAGVVVSGAVPERMRLGQEFTPFFNGALSPAAAGTFSQPPGRLYVQTDAAHGTTVQWGDDGAEPADPGAIECVLATNYTTGPGVILSGGAAHAHRLHATLVGATVAEFVSFRTFEVVTDSTDPERVGMSVKRLYRLWAPHAQENPVFFHATDTSTTGFQTEVDQLAATGFEMLIYSFGTSFNLETSDPAYLAQVKAQISYATSKGIEVGGYDLICLDRGNGGYGGNVGDQWDRVLDDGSLGPDACFASGWVDKLNDFAYGFINETGLTMLETDGPYGGGSCASKNHSHHLALSDSVYQQTQTQARWYAGLRARNVYINQPDDYFFQGGQ
jgi:hypothetical protein